MTGSDFFKLFDMAFRLAMLGLALVLLAFLMAAGARTALAASLKGTDVMLTADVLTVGDLFDNAGRNASYVLGPAPQPGREMVLNAQTLLRIAMALDLPWQPQSAAEKIVVRRAATLIPAEVVTEAIADKLRDKVADRNFALDTGASRFDLTLPHTLPGTVEVTNVTYNVRTARFEAQISAPNAANPVRQITVAGTVRPITMVPVLTSNLRNGDIIGQADLEWVEMYNSDLQPDTFTRAEDLVGSTPRRVAQAGRPLRTIDIQAPQLVARGESVTINFAEGPLNLTAMGRAMQHGARGDVIRVVNTGSNRTIDAIVTGNREVTVKQ